MKTLDQLPPSLSVGDLRVAAEEETQKAMILQPGRPALTIAESIIQSGDETLLKQLGRALLVRHFTLLVRSARRRVREQERRQHLLFPEWDQLPSVLVLKNKRVPFAQAKYRDAISYVAKLRREYKATVKEKRDALKPAHLEKPARLVQAEEWLVTMQRCARKHSGITAAEVAAATTKTR